MVAYFRQFLVVLLVLLQVAAPLVHAHVGKDVSARGLHLHEFEALHRSQHGPDLLAADHGIDSRYAIVNIGSAIKQPLADNLAPALLLVAVDLAPAADRQNEPAIFPAYPPRFVPEPFPSPNSSRAPPL